MFRVFSGTPTRLYFAIFCFPDFYCVCSPAFLWYCFCDFFSNLYGNCFRFCFVLEVILQIISLDSWIVRVFLCPRFFWYLCTAISSRIYVAVIIRSTSVKRPCGRIIIIKIGNGAANYFGNRRTMIRPLKDQQKKWILEQEKQLNKPPCGPEVSNTFWKAAAILVGKFLFLSEIEKVIKLLKNKKEKGNAQRQNPCV